ncbi:predicted protein [Histoplasma capsulatum H143]|uniref:Uncharacterized protein n=1 Tax=Ajellomyces capsulatus (strain H143) TaxID=544712 RepID=C6H6T6_AJECH|nr:predicted protein [Histoplasma capsulatum H143]
MPIQISGSIKLYMVLYDRWADPGRGLVRDIAATASVWAQRSCHVLTYMISRKGANSAKETSSTDISEIRKALLGWNSTILSPILQHTKSLYFGLNQHKPPSLSGPMQSPEQNVVRSFVSSFLPSAKKNYLLRTSCLGTWAVSRGLLQQRPLHQHDYGRVVSGWRSYLMQPILGTFPDKQGIRSPMFKRQRQWLNDKTSRPHRLAVPCSLRLSAISKKV